MAKEIILLDNNKTVIRHTDLVFEQIFVDRPALQEAYERQVDEAVKEFEERLEQKFRNGYNVEIIPGVKEALEFAKAQGYILAQFSTSSYNSILYSLEQAGINNLIDEDLIFSTQLVNVQKEDSFIRSPEGWKNVLRKIKQKGNLVAYVDDKMSECQNAIDADKNLNAYNITYNIQAGFLIKEPRIFQASSMKEVVDLIQYKKMNK